MPYRPAIIQARDPHDVIRKSIYPSERVDGICLAVLYKMDKVVVFWSCQETFSSIFS